MRKKWTNIELTDELVIDFNSIEHLKNTKQTSRILKFMIVRYASCFSG